MGHTLIPAGMEHDPQYYVPEYDANTQLEPNFFCRARNVKREKYCRARSGQGTQHFGVGRCRNHGGSVPIKHGRYSSVARASLGEHIDELELETDEEKLDIMPEATLLRALARDVGERYKEFMDAIISWNKKEGMEAGVEERKPKFLSLPDLKDIADLAKKTAEVVNMIHKQKSSNAISLTDFYRLMGAMAEAVSGNAEKYFKAVPPQQLEKFLLAVQDDWRKIKLKA